MQNKTCASCKHEVEEWNERCGGCGFTLELVPDEKRKARFLRGPSLGALLFTQGWALGARVYFWFLLSLIPVVGIAVLIVCVLFGRRWSWKFGGWESWEAFQSRMRLMDMVGVVWVAVLVGVYFYFRLG
jgi:hypothetical protein